ncbi:elongation of very long chain fatty acids protein 7-like [Mya arenaria]|uniref:elongation of very long chain fatty acids protein 7-like n=1 Tax=Mya arenaria TaxID=6604 RepID=UPI0022E55198|nr:elongation of very long chain fatty acids protein 7-like [Mya arenaria]
MSVIAQIKDFYDYVCSDIDPRVRDWPLMSRPVEPLLLVIAYLLFVALGPRWMATRKPFKLQSIIVFYNFFMVALCSYTVHEFLVSGWLFDYSLSCNQGVDYSNSPKAIRMAGAVWLFFIAKFIELLDTVFFILRKKTNQVTFLHVFHHGCLPVFWWWGVKAVPGGFGTFHGFVNCCVHVVMYLYYGISALGPDYQKYIWWKKYVTKFQLAQFFIVTIHNSQYLFRECAYPWKYVAFIQGFTTIIAGLFLNFYVKAYRRKTYSTVNENNKKDSLHSE